MPSNNITPIISSKEDLDKFILNNYKNWDKVETQNPPELRIKKTMSLFKKIDNLMKKIEKPILIANISGSQYIVTKLSYDDEIQKINITVSMMDGSEGYIISSYNSVDFLVISNKHKDEKLPSAPEQNVEIAYV